MKIDAKLAWLADGYKPKLFEDASLKQKEVEPTIRDNFLLTPQDDPRTFVEYNIGGQSEEEPRRPKTAQRRIKSASSVHLKDRPWRNQAPPRYPESFVPRSRPVSAKPTSTRPASAVPARGWSRSVTPSPRRVKSAGSTRTLAENHSRDVIDNLRKGFTLVNKLYDNAIRSSNIRLHPASPAPDYRYFDRHSRCYDHNHAHLRLSNYRPQPACGGFLESCGSRAISPARKDDPNVQPQRYIDYHRPSTAPTTRGELQYVQRPSSSRGHRPHFCNFVHQMHLHNKKTDETESTGVPDSEASENVDFIMESAEGRLINKYRKDSNHSSNSSLHRGLLKSPKLEDYEKDSIPEMKEEILLSGTEGRPGSPSSLDGDSCHGDVEDGNFTGIEVRVTSPVKFEQALVSKPKSDLTKHKPKREDHSECGGWRTGEPAPILEEVGDTDGGRTPADGPTPWDDSKSRKSVDSGSAGPSEGSRTERPPSPREPPPSPEPVQKAPPPTQAPARQPQTRGCVKKKTKKPIERIRTEKKMEEVTEAPPPVEEHPSSQDIPTDSEKVKPEVDIKVPELPSNVEKERSGRKEKAKHKRHQIEVEDDLVKPDIGEILNDQIKLSRPEFDWSNMDNNGVDDIKRPPQIKSWIQGRLALSQQSSRFELPMDMKLLEKMTPQEYIKKHCIITSRRQNLYQKIFLKNKDKTHTILIKDIDRSLKDVLVNTITSEQISDILHTLDIDENTKIDFKLFCGMAAYAERVLYPKFVTDDTHDMPEYQREKIECADFGALDWKIHGVKVPPKMLEVLREIC
ncbi:uncharacterized protein LOC128231412 isoform X5 [Mya arenaria]|uniref:uncharacterized protein LOC128231412 isoform X5 n=1 Tax=Mya arenaria TaxID=6604 RepID=UPI0022E7B167|nr:uncharacterized protein LOC128231412 isoform X5 [Mya arenaria]XP_052800172.1 uncharacterized protein LOC128231412 isoform X5 [Mya arenaria]XP_052800174.1 uncharacterized protein LOC128231412 isoform X5 [Mya arenaria]